MQLLVDTGATTTFINQKTLHTIKQYIYINKQSYSFVLADGIAPFQVLGIVELHIQFADQITKIHAHVAQNLCTDVILGMDYITFYNLKFDIHKQIVSIDHDNKRYQMAINKDVQTQFIPVVLSNGISIPSQSNCSAKVSNPISSISSSFVPHYKFTSTNSLFVSHKFLQFHNHLSHITLSNTSFHSQFISQGTCMGYLCNYSIPYDSHESPSYVIDSRGATKSIGESPDLRESITNKTSQDYSAPSIHCATIKTLHPSIEEDLLNLTKKITNPSEKDSLLTLLYHHHQLFDTTKHNIANTPIHHVINTIPHSPPASRPYPQADKEEPLYELIQEYLEAGLVTESHSPYAAPAFLVKKKDDTYRFVVDYKNLNLVTIKDSSPLPNMEDTINKLGQGYTHFSKLDLKSGFYQIPINHTDKEKTAFVTPFGHYQFNVLPMGLKNSPPTFQKVMTNTLKSCRQFAIVYLDDIVVFSKSYADHRDHLEQVFIALSARNLVLNPSKCELLVSQIDYLGHTISETTVTPLQDRIQFILDIKEPTKLAQANKFIGALSWYRKFIPNFATTAAPIHSVTNLTKNKRYKFKWRYAQSKAFHQLKQMLTSAPLFLHYPIDNKPLILSTDASGIAIGGVLQQDIDGQLHNLYYHSQVMTPCERKYSTIEKEALAIYKCFVRMRSFLLGRSIIIMTDHCPLCHIMTKTVNNARVDRIANLIQEYNLEQVLHIEGRRNCLPDYLSRYPIGQSDDLFDIEYGLTSKREPVSLPSPASQLLATMVLRPRNNKPSLDITSSSDNNTPPEDPPSYFNSNTDSSLTPRLIPHFSSNQFDITNLRNEQHNDFNIQKCIKQLQYNQHNSSFILKDDILYKLIVPSSLSKTKIQVVYLPSSMITPLLYACHNDPMSGGHFSTDRTYDKIRNYYWWPDMKYSIKQHIKSCLPCQQYNVSRQKRHGQLRSISPPEGPFQLIGIDYCGPLKRTPRENQYVLIITDYFTRHITAIPLPNCTAETTAEALFNEYFCKYGVPVVIISDQGTHFHNQLMKNMRLFIGYNHIYSTPYHPQTNGIVERFNSTFLPQISKLQDSENNNWDEYLQAVVFAYNSGVHKTTNYSPYELLYGRPPRLPFHTPPTSISFQKPNDYFEQLKKTQKIYHQFSTHNIKQQQTRNKTYYDRNRPDPHYNIGDFVLTRIHGIKGKLDPTFSITPKIIIETHHPVYIVQDEHTQVESQVHVSDLRSIILE
ncbi:unnamed protein product [Adineta steineri]|uniref:RNA-directed DNA polymerase n=2 Tax=Adineta steineri TaxID=433720 RepID=A0A815SJ25_9BILA|nr:unnamed protein product [Adineta steineri]CAF4053850.1 unnamed protein product [Adineta steineri]